MPSDDNGPVVWVSWKNAQAFCKWLSGKAGVTIRLPTEAGWEYACRAGTKTEFSAGDKDSDLEKAAWYAANSGDKTHPVGLKAANAFGLFDMHGNVWEWCQDWHGEYPSGALTDPSGASSGSDRVLRGGSWGGPPAACRSAYRYYAAPTHAGNYYGFRVVGVR